MSLLEKPSEVQLKKSYSMLIYGKSGLGKTTTALSAKNPVLLDFEHGMDRVKSDFWVPRLIVDNYQKVIDFINSDEVDQFDTVVIDSVGALIDKLVLYVAEKNPKMRKEGGIQSFAYGIVKARLMDLLRNLTDKNKNLIFVAHSEEKDNEKKETCILPKMGAGKSGYEILNMLDVIGYMDKVSGVNTLRFDSQDVEFFTKNILDLPELIPVRNPAFTGKNTFIQDVIDKYQEKRLTYVMNSRREFEATTDDMNAELASVENCDDCNRALAYFKSEERYQNFKGWKEKLYTKAKSLGLDYNKETEAFEGKDEEENVVDNSIAA